MGKKEDNHFLLLKYSIYFMRKLFFFLLITGSRMAETNKALRGLLCPSVHHFRMYQSVSLIVLVMITYSNGSREEKNVFHLNL